MFEKSFVFNFLFFTYTFDSYTGENHFCDPNRLIAQVCAVLDLHTDIPGY